MKKVIVLLLILLLLPSFAHARIGVGVASGKIQVDEILKPGTIYQLPPLTVMNTGDEDAEYTVGVAYHQEQEEIPPPKEWFIFSPSSFHLEAGKSQVVNIKLNLPIRAQPGKYFAYLEAFPDKKSESGTATVGVAAAAKLYFEVEAANIFTGIYYKLVTSWQVYAPWPQWISGVIILITGIALFKKHFNIQIKKREDQTHKDE